MSIRLFYDRWPQYNRHLVDVVGALTDEQLALRASADHWPIWATVAHLAAVRLYWLCNVLKEPGAERTRWPDLPGRRLARRPRTSEISCGTRERA